MEKKFKSSVYEEQILDIFREKKFDDSEYDEKIASDIKSVKSYLETLPDDEEVRNQISSLVDWSEYMLSVINLDHMTGLYSRRILPRIRNLNNDVAVMIDMDDFKKVNASFGHQTGDEVIRKIAEVILKNTRATDYPCHIGGDEFLIIYIDAEIEGIKSRVESMLKEITEVIRLPKFKATMSAGIAYGEGRDSLVETIKFADNALYESKEKGKNRITVYQDSNK